MKRVIDDIKNFKGNVLCIGDIDYSIMRQLEKSNKVNVLELKREAKRKLFSKQKRAKISQSTSVKIKKFRKIFKKKSIEYVIIDLNSMFDFYKYLASNSIYVCSKKIYLYGNSEYINAKMVSKKFKRYTKNIDTIQNGNEYIVVVDCKNTKFSLIKEKIYLIIDTFCNIGDMISYFLTS